ncbi:RagB/SusD family nutrient uptake outer membrane protein [Formosa sp. PL04]|uniref:RagB/SusD family nutrient uptake outer membrane protein n=1 Tax=Formosa sp. PL04 TaxID=3081755 RepID=UPI002980AD26|nr:RagB/SusD family nutrient uptake outer membrane protein [Formosa sp. PL04]MDW5288073.1 RagB/SusD family nutrient uptake outer membrane protein [Formosa sp. PL04]
MKRIIFKYTMVLFVVGAFTACQDNEFLNETNPNEISKDNFWRNLNETGAGLNAVYKTLHSPYILNVIEEMQRSDMGYPGYGRPVPQATEPFYNHTYTESTNRIGEKWLTNYQGVFRANQVIEGLEGIEDVTTDRAEWYSQMAQARFLRGLFHFYLYTTYNNGSIIIRDKVAVTNDDFAKPVSSPSEVIAFIREDLEYAYSHLYKKGEYPSGDLSRVTAGAAATILGTSYLYDLDYATAMIYFDDVINNQGYQLVYDQDKLFTTAGEFNNESIFEISFTEDFIQIDLNRWNGDSGTNWLNQQTTSTRGASGPAWITYAYKTEQMDPLDSRNYYMDPIKGETQRSVPLRASAMMAMVEDTQTDYYLVSTSDYTRFNGRNWGFGWWKKYSNHDIVAAENELPNGSATLSSKNVTVNRLADVILMQAECKIKTGNVQGGLDLINQVRKRWGLVLYGTSGADASSTYDDVSYTANTAMHQLMYVDKPLETGAEGHCIRWLDFQRWKKSENYGFADRLQELSNMSFYGVDYSYTNAEGQPRTNFNNPSLSLQPSGEDQVIVDYEYDKPAANYSESTNGYYPIPVAERNTNN